MAKLIYFLFRGLTYFCYLAINVLNLINLFCFCYFQSFFGRTYNNLSSISECKNNGDCIINKKNRTACKACRLRKCLLVGMSKSGSRYGRRSNWFKIHCLLQEQQQKNTNNSLPTSPGTMPNNNTFMPSHFLTNLCNISKHDARITQSPSDSGASSADLDENNREGSIESFSVESKTTEKSSISSPPAFESMRTTFSPYLHHNGRSPAFLPSVTNQIPVSTIIYATTAQTPSAAAAATMSSSTPVTNEQDEPMDLSFKSRKRRRTPTPPPSFDIPKPAPLDLTLVRGRPLSG